jgi:hypothetical protein
MEIITFGIWCNLPAIGETTFEMAKVTAANEI